MKFVNWTIVLLGPIVIRVTSPCVASTHSNTSSRKELCTNLVEMKVREGICQIKERECDSYTKVMCSR
ncbi:hypothetical protein Bca4012_050565 [Brassica carinata]